MILDFAAAYRLGANAILTFFARLHYDAAARGVAWWRARAIPYLRRAGRGHILYQRCLPHCHRVPSIAARIEAAQASLLLGQTQLNCAQQRAGPEPGISRCGASQCVAYARKPVAEDFGLL